MTKHRSVRFHRGHSTGGHAFTLVELLIVLAIVGLLAVLLIPMALQMAERANAAKCIGNLRQISMVSVSYSSDNRGDWPPNAVGTVYAQYLIPYLGRIPGTKDRDFLRSPLICPSARRNVPDSSYSFRGIYTPTTFDPDRGKYGLSYAQNTYAPGSSASTRVANRLAAENPSAMMLYMDLDGHYLVSLGRITNAEHRNTLMKRHNGLVNVAYADGSVRSIPYDDIPTTQSPVRLFWSGRGIP
jgi:prepilin-type N-terminal cleavage/methylation domain-containing protein/prepilin-type processing-associated H-X9-DG protein